VLFVACGTFLKVMVARESFLQVVACESFLKISVASQTFAVFIKGAIINLIIN
jgi:hypothetical protein